MVDYNELYSLTKDFTILYAEDDKNFAQETCNIFSLLFKKVDFVIDGKDAYSKYLSYYQKNSTYYDIVISDINMPKMDGIELTKEIYKINKNQSIVIISAHNDSNYLFDLVNLGIEQFLIKPLNINKIYDTLYTTSKKIIEKQSEKTESNIIILNKNYYWNNEDRSLYDNNKNIKLSKKEILLMQLFIKNNTRVSTFEEIFYQLWDENAYQISHNTLKPIIFNLRQKLPYQKIESVSKLGYKLIF